MKLQDT